jgi:cell division protein FtsQ
MQDNRKTRVTETVTETIAMNPVSSGDTVSSDGVQDGGETAGEGAETEPEEPETDPETEAIKQRIRERKREKRRKARIRKARFWTVLSLILFVIAGMIFSLSSFFTVDLIEVEGNSHFTDEEIINIAHAVPGHNLIYNPDKTSIKEYLVQNPYIKSAEVTRKLPSTLVITVEERKQACYFKYDDDYLVIDNEGILLKKTRTEPKTTTVTGLVVTRMKLGETIGTENQQMFSRLMKLIRQIEKADLYFVKIDMSNYKDDQAVSAYIYSKLVVKSDYDTLMQNLKNGRLHKVVEKLFDDGVERGTITLSGDDDISFEPGI